MKRILLWTLCGVGMLTLLGCKAAGANAAQWNTQTVSEADISEGARRPANAQAR
jgi:hypothetical protein